MTDEPLSLREITAKTVRAICALAVAPSQARFVAPNAWSIAEAHFSTSAWFRAIYAGETPVGFVMVDRDAEPGRPYLWRFMIAAGQQGRGYGRRALELVLDEVCRWPGVVEVWLGYTPGDGEPRGFYERLGFVETGELEEDERVMRRPIGR